MALPQARGSFQQEAEKIIGARICCLEWSPTMDLLAYGTEKGELHVHRLSWQRLWSVTPRCARSRMKPVVDMSNISIHCACQLALTPTKTDELRCGEKFGERPFSSPQISPVPYILFTKGNERNFGCARFNPSGCINTGRRYRLHLVPRALCGQRQSKRLQCPSSHQRFDTM
jgi:hypothetical protein